MFGRPNVGAPQGPPGDVAGSASLPGDLPHQSQDPCRDVILLNREPLCGPTARYPVGLPSGLSGGLSLSDIPLSKSLGPNSCPIRANSHVCPSQVGPSHLLVHVTYSVGAKSLVCPRHLSDLGQVTVAQVGQGYPCSWKCNKNRWFFNVFALQNLARNLKMHKKTLSRLR